MFCLLLVFSVTPFKIDQNQKSKPFNRLSLESGNRKKVDMRRLSPRFRSQQFFLWMICGETFFPKFIEICMETPGWCPPRWAPTWRPETSKNICHWVLLQKCEFISRRTQKRNNNALFQYKNCSDSWIPRNKSPFKPTSQLSRPSCKCHVTQKLRNSSAVYH